MAFPPEYITPRFFAWRERTTEGDWRRHRLADKLGELTSAAADATAEAMEQSAIQVDGERFSLVIVMKDATDQTARSAAEGTKVKMALAQFCKGRW